MNLAPTHYCKTCSALWRQCDDRSWNLRSPKAGPCCDNAAMGDQIAPLTTPKEATREALPADLEALMPEPAAFCDPSNPLNGHSFAWPGTGRGFMHTAPLFTADQMREAIRGATERAAKLAAPRGVRPCDCDICDCGNSGDLRQVTDWDASAAIAAAIRSGGEAGS